ncbi:MAG TPA: DUF4097 family beta strand repeat-containing protein [Candidatus Saccharimonadales bacterium]|nr:DUF4097 family beta strand repeat-containing protein [Candidatus Saccharimonadales bacterium]
MLARDDGPSRGSEIARTLRMEVTPAEGQGFRLENLAGTLEVVRSEGPSVAVEVTVRSDSEQLAELVRLERSEGKDGGALVRVVFPLDRHRTFRYSPRPPGGSQWLNLLGGGSRWGGSYGGEHVEVAESDGAPLHADVKISLPEAVAAAEFLNRVGAITAHGIAGDLTFTSSWGPIDLRDLQGRISADAESEDLVVSGLRGSLRCSAASGSLSLEGIDEGDVDCTTASGDIRVQGGSGGRITLKTASGSIELRGASAREVDLSTASGDVDLEGGELPGISVGTASGDIRISVPDAKAGTIAVSTASGDVRIGLAEDAAFETRGRIRGGRIKSLFDDATPVREENRIVGYRRGEGGVRIEVNSMHGDLTLQPLR